MSRVDGLIAKAASLPALLALALSLTLGECCSPSGTDAKCGGPPPTPPNSLGLRDGVIVLDSLALGGVTDVTQEGSEIAAVVSGVSSPTVYISTDQGRTWAGHPISGVTYTYASPPAMYVHLYTGKLTLVVLRDTYFEFHAVDLSTNKTTLSPDGMRAGFLSFVGDRIISYDAGSYGWRFYTYSVTTQRVTFTSGAFATLPAPCLNAAGGAGQFGWQSPDGNRFAGFCKGDPRTDPNAQACELMVTLSTSHVPNAGCVPLSQWPPYEADPNYAALPHAMYFIRSGIPAQVYTTHLSTVRVTSLAQLVPPVIADTELAPGHWDDAVDGSSHARYAGMVAVHSPNGVDPDKLIRVPATGPLLNVAIPPSACVGQKYCQYGGGVTEWEYAQVQRLLSLGNDDYLVFYAFYSGPDPLVNIPGLVCISREHVPPTAL